ncbi:hypothetical protein CJ030_MR8G028982 [Morella rubra]|uniref:Anther-specific protein BCP1 n=1 Tax=Morella rubra TaxID=262757 RepID=A0A6A1UQV9_9ROSI|nr:hypothetical protein CJ030_MR8G028982 [Morella rubra]
MARQISVLILVFAIVGLAFAEIKAVSSAADAPAPTSTSGPSDAIIGSPAEGSGGEDVTEAPIGGPVSPGAFSSTGAEGPGPNSSGAAAVKALGVAGALVAGGIVGFFPL